MSKFKHTIKSFTAIRLIPFFIISMIGLSAALIIIIAPRPLQAETGTPFGGLSTYIHYCTCNSNPADIAVTVIDLSTTPGSPPNYVYSPGLTILHPYGMVYTTGTWLLGNRTQASVCLYYAGKSCATWPTSGMMVRVGTSGG